MAHYSSMSCIRYSDWSRNPEWLAYVLCYAFKLFVFNINIKAVKKRNVFLFERNGVSNWLCGLKRSRAKLQKNFKILISSKQRTAQTYVIDIT